MCKISILRLYYAWQHSYFICAHNIQSLYSFTSHTYCIA